LSYSTRTTRQINSDLWATSGRHVGRTAPSSSRRVNVRLIENVVSLVNDQRCALLMMSGRQENSRPSTVTAVVPSSEASPTVTIMRPMYAPKMLESVDFGAQHTCL